MVQTKKIVIVTHFLVHRDAIGNDIQIEAEVLRTNAYEVLLFANQTDEFFANKIASLESTLECLQDVDSILIYHHSCYNPNMETLFNAARGRIIIKYHNITPAKYFSHNPMIQEELNLAVKQTELIAKSPKIDLFLGDSAYNNQDLIDLGAPQNRSGTLAPFHFVEDFKDAGVNQSLAAHLKDGRFNILFVGRLMRHKGHLNLIESLDHYLAMYDTNVRLCLVGRLENPFYGDELVEAINSRRLSNFVEIYQDVNFQDLHTFYQSCHAFFMMSEHEGFGVPILEAQFHRLPIVTIDRAAVKQTVGSEQLVFAEDDPAIMAAALYRLKKDTGLNTHVKDAGEANYSLYSKENLAHKFLGFIKQLS